MNTRTIYSRFRQAIAAGVLLLAGTSAAFALEIQQGVHYKLLTPAQPTNVAPGKVEVVEVFWYACGHCYLLEPRLEAWDRKGRPANAQLVRLPATWNNMLKTHARQAGSQPRDMARDQRQAQHAGHAGRARGFLHLARRRQG
jgi:hypothetical protein